MNHIAVVGAGAAGLAAAECLRREGFDGRLTLLGAEPTAPYDRPPLSKHVLAGAWEFSRTLLRPADHYARLGIELRTGRRARGLDLGRRTLRLDRDELDRDELDRDELDRDELDRDEELRFDGLIIATGVAPRRLPFGHDLDGVHVLRDEGDARRLRTALDGRPRVVVIGAGFLGMEVAAVARGLGLDVSVVDPLPTPMGRQFGARMGTLIADLHRAHGVRLFTGVGVSALRDSGGRVTGVLLDDDRLLPADCVLVAIGAAPDLGWLRGTEVPLGDGIECDAYCQAGPALYAAGDVASWPSPRYGRRLRLEHRMNATEQGTAAALNLLHGNIRVFDPVPYFWTDQFDVKIQAHGIFPAGAEPVIAEGRPSDGKFVARYEEGGRTVGVLGWNSPREVRRYRQQFTEAVTPGGAT